jgi:hypothetical protein
MATTWTVMNAKLNEFLGDPDMNAFDQPLRIQAWNNAQRLLAVFHTPRQVTAALEMEEDERTAILPDDFIAVWRIYDAETAMFLKRFKPAAGAYRVTDDQLDMYWVFGNRLYFEKDIAVGDTDRILYYHAYWPDVEYVMLDGVLTLTEEKILVPRWSELPLCHLCAAECLVPMAVSSARLREYNVQVDSGTPVQNSRAVQMREHLYWWNMLTSMVKPIDYKAG